MHHFHYPIKVRNQKLARAVGDVLHATRLEQGLTQEKLAELSGYDRAYLSEVELAKKAVSLQAIVAFIGALEMSPVSFFERVGEVMSVNGNI